MKNLSLFVSAFAICASTSYAAINCSTLPTCESLGYSDVATQCPKSVNGEEMVIRCPFDAAKGKCVYEAAVGQIGYFTKAPDAASGWLLCDGKSYSYTKYPQLAKLIGIQFGGTVNNTFNVPDYRGFFLRVYAEEAETDYVRSDFSTYAKGDVNNSVTSPQKEGLPNIEGKIIPTNTTADTLQGDYKGAFYYLGEGQKGAFAEDWQADQVYGFGFEASRSNPIYGSSSGVTPPNMAVYAYIYAGKVVK